MAGSGMEVDPPSTSSMSVAVGAPLKRSNSAPMINVLSSVCPGSPLPACHRHHHEHDGHCTPNSTTACSTATNTFADCGHSNSHLSLFRHSEISPRTRRFSASYSVGLHSPTAAAKNANRLDQIKHEESIHVVEREVAHEREVQSAMQMSLSWDDLSLQDDTAMATEPKRPRPFGEPLHIFTSPYPFPSSTSPTRVGKQCFSPSLQSTVKPGTTPSPTRKTFTRRSVSPITLRPSPLSIKRKLRTGDFEDNERYESYFSPPKRFHPLPGGSTPERLPTTINHTLIHCLSSSPSESGSPEQQVPNLSMTSSPNGSPAGSLLSTIAPSAFTFRPVRPLLDTHTTDSESSDMTEPTEMSHSDSHSDGNPVPMERDTRSDNSLNINMDPSPASAFNPGSSRPTQV